MRRRHRRRIFGGALGLRYSRAIPSNSNYRERLGRAHPRTCRSRSTVSRRSRSRRRAAQLGRPARACLAGNSAWIDYQGRARPSLRRISFVDVYYGRFKDSDVRGKVVVVGATAPVAAGPAPDLDDRQRPDAGPGDPGQRDRHRAGGLPAATDAPAGSTSWLLVLLGIAGAARQRCACASSVALAIGALVAGGVPRRRADRLRRDGLIVTVVYPLVAGIGGAARHGRRPRRHRRLRARAARATPSRASSPRRSSTRCCAAPTATCASAACSARAR